MGLFDRIATEPPLDLGGGVRVGELQTKWRLLLAEDGRVLAEAYTSVERGSRLFFMTAFVALEPKPGEAPAWLPSYEACSLTTYRIGDTVEGAVLASVADYGITDVVERSAGINPEAFERLKAARGAERSRLGDSETVTVKVPRGTLRLTRFLRDVQRAHLFLTLEPPAKTLEEADKALDEVLSSLGLL
jgi:hypothetical protein